MKPNKAPHFSRRTGLLQRFAAVLLVLFASACGQDRNVATRIDGEWYLRNLEEAHLSHWLHVLPTANGFFNTAVNRKWQPIEPQPGDLVGQTRAIYVMAIGYELTGNPEYINQVKRGTDFLLTSFRDPTYGGWFEAVAPDGKVQNGNKRLYGHAFAILALAHAYRVTKDQRYLDAALQSWQEIDYRFADGTGGYKAGLNQDFTKPLLDNSQNPIMHLFEALQALYEASGSSQAREGANRIGNFVAYKLLQGLEDSSARIPELYDSEWKALDQAHGGYIDIGHQFEWAYLFSAGAEAGLNPIFAGVAERLLNYALLKGYDKTEGGVLSSVSPDHSNINRSKGYWQQAEALRALMHHATIRGRSDLWGQVTQMTEFIQTEFIDRENGGWFSSSMVECRRGRCPDRQPDGYHMTALHHEAIRLANTVR